MTMTKEEVNDTMTFLDNEYREIITKAVCGKGRKYSKATHTISPTLQVYSGAGLLIINIMQRKHQKML